MNVYVCVCATDKENNKTIIQYDFTENNTQ